MMKNNKERSISVVLFNLGGPDSLESVRPFLYNLFNDPYIINLPNPFRSFLAWLISTTRNKKSQEIYKKIGGKSPLLENTHNQADALKKHLQIALPHHKITIHICMRYWNPRALTVISEIIQNDPDEIVLLPLYPQFSTTTTKSSFEEFKKIKNEGSLLADKVWHEIESYESHPLFIKAHVSLINEKIKDQDMDNSIFLFSAHGIPQDRIDQGDPYQKHVETSVLKIMEFFPDQDYKLCYQSKVGPKKWLLPSTEKTIEHYAKENKTLIIIPIAFVSDHVETLVELDDEYEEVARNNGVKKYLRVDSLSVNPYFIECLADLTQKAINISL